MKVIGIVSTAVLSLILAAPVYAQEQHDQDQEKAKPEENEKKAQPEKSAKPEEKSAKPEEKNARQENNAKPEEKVAPRENNSKPEERNAQVQHAQPAQRARLTVVAAFPTIVTRPTLDSNTLSALAKAITTITASNTAAIPSDSLARGQATGSTRKTFMSSILTECTTCVIRHIPESTSSWPSHSSAKRAT